MSSRIFGIYYLNGTDADKDISITLWDTEGPDREPETGNKIRSETSTAQKTEILEVEEFEVTTKALKCGLSVLRTQRLQLLRRVLHPSRRPGLA